MRREKKRKSNQIERYKPMRRENKVKVKFHRIEIWR
jgi:hypothetical protein